MPSNTSCDKLAKRLEILEKKYCCLAANNCCYVELTLLEAQELLASNAVVPNQLYKVTGVHKNKPGDDIETLYDDGSDSGIDILVTGLTTNEFSSEGYGFFYNPIYDRENYGEPEGNYGVSLAAQGTGYTDALGVATTGGTGVGMTVDITTDAGNVVTIGIANAGTGYLAGDLLTIDSGDTNATFNVSLGINLYNIWDGDNPNVYNTPLYPINTKKVWGPYVWNMTIGNSTGSAQNITTLTDGWEKIPYNDTDYTLVLDYIEYDWTNDWILRRKETDNNIDVTIAYSFIDEHAAAFDSIHPIAATQWGNGYVDSYGCSSLLIDNSIFDSINFKGKELRGIVYKNGSFRMFSYFGFDTQTYNIVFNNDSYQLNVKVNRTAKQYNMYFENESGQGSFQADTVLIDRGSVQSDFNFSNSSKQQGVVTLDNNSFQSYFTFINNSYQGGESSYITLLNNSSQADFFLVNSSSQNTILLDNFSSQNKFNLTNFSSQEDVSLDAKAQSNITYDGFISVVGGTPVSDSYTSATRTEIIYRWPITFTSAAGSGAVGALTIPLMQVPSNYFISKVKLHADTLTYDPTAYITLGIQTDDIDSGLDIVTGDMVTLDTNPVAIITSLPFSLSTSITRVLVMEVHSAIIYTGNIGFEVTLNNLLDL